MPRKPKNELTPPKDIDDAPVKFEEAAPKVDEAALCGGHVKQLDAIRTLLDPNASQYQAWYCSRRAAKSHGMAIHALKVAIEEPGTNQIYTALVRAQAKEAMWRTKWIPLVDGLFGEGYAKHNHTNQQTIFPNGSSVGFGGVDDLKHIQTLLGQGLRCYYSDESQGIGSSLLKNLIEDVIGPAISDTPGGKFLLAGMLPDVPAGHYYEAITSDRWTVKNWNRFDNPFLTEDQHKALAEYLRVTGYRVEDPEVQRRWFGRLVFDPNATAFRYKREIASYRPWPMPWDFEIEPGTFLCAKPPPGIDTFALGTDPGTRDRWAFVLWGWNSKRRDVCYEIAEWVTPRNARKRNGDSADWNDATAVADAFYSRYETIVRFFRDAGSSQETLDLFGRYVGRMVVKAANKTDLGAQVERFASMLASGGLKVIEGGQL